MLPIVARLIAQYALRPLPVEGTLYAATYRSAALDQAGRACASAMVGMYCTEPPSRSLFHRLAADEVWHFYGGDPLRLVLLHADGSSSEHILGSDAAAGQRVQCVVPAGTWQAGELQPGGQYALFGCTVAPAFRPEMFEGGTRATLLPLYPDRAADIEALCCAPGSTHLPELDDLPATLATPEAAPPA